MIDSPEPENDVQPIDISKNFLLPVSPTESVKTNDASPTRSVISSNGYTTNEKLLPPVPPRTPVFHAPEKIEIPSHIGSTKMKIPKPLTQFTDELGRIENKKLFSHNPFAKDDLIDGFDSDNASGSDLPRAGGFIPCSSPCYSGDFPKVSSTSERDINLGAYSKVISASGRDGNSGAYPKVKPASRRDRDYGLPSCKHIFLSEFEDHFLIFFIVID